MLTLNSNYTGEKWRNGGNTTPQRLDFQYQIGATNITSGSWTDFNGGTDAIADNYVKVIQGSSSNNFSVQIDADGSTGGDIFRLFIAVNLLGTGNLNSSSNFVF